MADGLISVIIPVYNVEKYLRKCLDTVINQTYKNLEIIIVDDGSTDSSGLICDEYEKKDSRIKVFHKENGGLSDARNVGIDNANGDYIGFVDSDDYIELDMYEKLYDACVRQNAEIAICGRKSVNEAYEVLSITNTTKRERLFNCKNAISNLLIWNNCDSAAWDKLYMKELFSDIRYPFGKLHEDLNVTCRLFSKCKRIVQVPYPLYNYLVRDSGICRQAFSKKRFDLYEQARGNIEFVNTVFPDLNKEMDYFIFACSLGVMVSLSDSASGDLDDYRRVKEIMKKVQKVPFNNNYFNFKSKILFIKRYLKFYLKYFLKIIYKK